MNQNSENGILAKIVSLAIHRREIVIALALMVATYGLFCANRAKMDIFPDFAPPRVKIKTQAPGHSPRQVEHLITHPIEVAVDGVMGLKSLRSMSIQGISVVKLYFKGNTNILVDRQQVSERLNQIAKEMPAGASAPEIQPLTSATSTVLMIGLTSKTKNLQQLRTFSDYILKPRLLSSPGVAKVVTFGGRVQTINIEPIPKKLKAYGISINELVDRAREATGIRGAGFIETPNQRVTLRAMGQNITPDELGRVVIRRTQGMNVRIQDVAQIKYGSKPIYGDAQIMGKRGVVLTISDQYGANTLDVTRAIDQRLAKMKSLFAAQKIHLYDHLFKPADFVREGVHHMLSSLYIGGLLVVIVLFLFLWDLRVSFISLTAIPLSLLIAIIFLEKFGFSLNTLTLGGLAIAVGEVVDDAIVDVENIHRRLRENAKSVSPLPSWKVVLSASLEVRSAVVYATFVVLLVFIPIVTMGGVQGRLFAPLGFAYIFSILASLGIALVLTPALSYQLLTRRREPDEPTLTRKIREYYKSKLRLILERPHKAIAFMAIFMIAAICTIPFLGSSFLPDFQEGHYIVHMNLLTGSSVRQSIALGKRFTKELERLPEVTSIVQTTGTAGTANDTNGPFQSEFNVNLRSGLNESPSQIKSKFRAVFQEFPEANFSMNTFLAERMNETVSGDTAPISVNIFGSKLSELDKAAQEVEHLLERNKDAVGIQILAPPTVPEMTARLIPSKLNFYGFDPVGVLNTIQAGFQGEKVGQVYQGIRVTDVDVKLPRRLRDMPEQLGSLPLKNSDGRWIELSQLANLKMKTGQYEINHIGGQRCVTVSSHYRGSNLVRFTQKISRLIESRIHFPKGIYAAVSGVALLRAQAQRQLASGIALVFIAILIVLWAALKSWRNLTLVLFNLPFCLVGGVLAAFACGGNISLGTLIGFVTLFGITTRNSLMLISHYEYLVEHGHEWNLETALAGAGERFLPIVMTATVTGLGLLPLALAAGSAGREIEGPMATVILGGLISSTALTLIILPFFSLKFAKFAQAKTN